MPPNNTKVVETLAQAAQFFGVDVSAIAAGFIGSVLSLVFIRKLTLWQLWVNVFVGSVAANYLSPVHVVHVWGDYAVRPGGIAFVIGFSAMGLCGGLMSLLLAWRENPTKILRIFWPGKESK